MTENKRLRDCLEFFVLLHEGKVNEEVDGDPGGRTHWGITQADYDEFRRGHNLPTADVFTMLPAEVYAVYEEHYWKPMHCDTLPRPLDLVTLDCAVNMGCRKATKILQQVLGLTYDGVWGPKTTAAVSQVKDPKAIAAKCITLREATYERLVRNNSRLRKFLRGWLNRCDDLRSHL